MELLLALQVSFTCDGGDLLVIGVVVPDNGVEAQLFAVKVYTEKSCSGSEQSEQSFGLWPLDI